MPETTAATAKPAPAMAKKPEWAPRIWEGCNLYAWFRLLFKNRFAVHPSRIYIAIIVTFVATLHTVLRIVQEIVFFPFLFRKKLAGPPVFILGHWRTGTTLLHELMIQDPRFSYPTTYQCMDPNHFLLTERLFSKFFGFLMPKERPMDRMKAGWDRPQEDEFALCMLGVPSPYLSIAFPNRPPTDAQYLDFEGVSPSGIERWKRGLMRFLVRITYKTGKRIVLKSPPHTARVRVLAPMFPGAPFIHIVRDPRVVFPSTVNLWRTLHTVQGLQAPTHEGLEEQVIETFLRMYDRLEIDKKLLPPEQFFELKYEDLVRDPKGMIRRIYDHFHLGGWDEMEPRLDAFLAGLKGYETNKYNLSPEQTQLIENRWGEVIRRYGYGAPTS